MKILRTNGKKAITASSVRVLRMQNELGRASHKAY
jgi:hypothetical protein